MTEKHTDRGFTLIELMIVVAIVAILAAIAYPSYTEQVARGRRGEAQAALLKTAQWIERQYTVTSAYDKYYKEGVLTGLATASLPALEGKVADLYTLSYGTSSAAATPTASGYSVRMAPKAGMAGDRCGTFALTQTGAKTVSGAAGVAACWDR